MIKLKYILLILVFFLNLNNLYSQNETLLNICGNNICEDTFNYNNCPQDCISYRVELASNSFKILRGEELRTYLKLFHYPEKKESLYNISISKELINFISFSNLSVFFDKQGIKFLDFNISSKNYSVDREIIGDIIVKNEYHEIYLPIRLEFLNKNSKNVYLSSKILSNQIFTSDEIVYKFILNFNSVQNESALINLSLKHLRTSHEIYLDSFNISTNTSYNQINTFKLNNSLFYINESYLLGEYEFIVRVKVDEELLYDSSIFVLNQSFTESVYFDILLIILVGSQIYLVFYYLIKRYLLYKKNNQRYINPDLKDLPKLNKDKIVFEVGLIAETKHKAYLVAKDLTTHGLVAGSTGSGKSVSASIIIEEALNNKIPVVVFDPTSQWTGFLSSLKDKNILNFYPKFGLKPEDARSYKGLIFTPKNKEFDINFEEYLNPGEITVFNLAHLSIQDYDEVTEKIIKSIFEKGWEESPELKLLCVFDEVHRLLDPSCEGKGYAALTKGAREFRKWGIGLLMASQVSSDFKEAIGGNVLTEIQLNTKNLEDIKKAQEKYGEIYGKRIARQGLGVAMVQNPAYNGGKPWFINFRPPLHNPHKLLDEELKTYDDFTSKLKLIKNAILELKEKNQDVSDYELDYNLANNKLKEGKFKMSDIYIQGLFDKLNLNTKNEN